MIEESVVLEFVFNFEGSVQNNFISSSTEHLWQGACVELFVKDKNEDKYKEFNFSFDGRFICYNFKKYRELEMMQTVNPNTLFSRVNDMNSVSCRVMIPDCDIQGKDIAVSAVTMDEDGVKDYWGIDHWGESADFHHPNNLFHFNEIT